MEQFKEDSQTFMVHAPYRGIGPAILDTLGGQTQALFPGLAAALPHIQAKKLRALAVTGAKRHRLLPDIPTMQELGFAGFDGVQWYGLMGPANLPRGIVTRHNTEINAQINLPEVRDKLSSEALDVLAQTPEQFAAYVRADIAKWTRLMQVRKIDLD